MNRGDISSARRRRMFEQAVVSYNIDHRTEISSREAWDVFKGLLGQSNQQDMATVIGMVYADPVVLEQVRDLDIDDDHSRAIILRNKARRVMRTYRREHFDPRPRPYNVPVVPPPARVPEQAPPAVPVVLQPAPPVPQAIPLPPVPILPYVIPPRIPAAAAAVPVAPQPPQNEVPRRLPSTYEFLKGIIERTGKIDAREIALAGDDLTPAQVETLFSLMREWGECPICLEQVPRRFRWTFNCGDVCCQKCMVEFIFNALESTNFPVMCPGRCGHSIDPRMALDVSATNKSGSVSVPENFIRFVSLQLASTHVVDPVTVRETHICPFCRAIVTGRPTASSPIGRCTNPFCAQRFCTNCKTPWHEGVACEDRMKVDVESDAMLSNTSKSCPRCGRRASHFKYHACHHLRCPCGHEYCYECLGPWSDHAVGKTKESCRIFCHDGCHCPPCDECQPGKPCKVCVTGCSKCRITV